MSRIIAILQELAMPWYQLGNFLERHEAFVIRRTETLIHP